MMRVARRDGAAGLIAPSFVNSATADDINLILWRWSSRLPHSAIVHNPSGGLPKSPVVMGLTGQRFI